MIRDLSFRGREMRLLDVNAATRFVCREGDDWEPDTFDALDRFLTGGPFVDVGAWCGIFSMYAASRSTVVYALEPDPVAFGLLMANLRLNDIGNVVALPFALWPESPVKLRSHHGWGDSMTGISREGVEQDFAALSVDQVRHLVGVPDLVKVDIEGGESQVVGDLLGWEVPLHVSVHVQEMSGGLPDHPRTPERFGDNPNYYSLVYS